MTRYVVARCTKTKNGFGMRLVLQGERWQANGAFILGSAAAQQGGYDKTPLTGGFELGPDYPGCPHCSATGISKCTCNKLAVACWDGKCHTVKCPWCGNVSEMSSGKIDLTGSSEL